MLPEPESPKRFNWTTDSLNTIWTAHHNAYPRSHQDYMRNQLLPEVRFNQTILPPPPKPAHVYPGGREYNPVVLEGWNKSAAGGWNIPSRLSR